MWSKIPKRMAAVVGRYYEDAHDVSRDPRRAQPAVPDRGGRGRRAQAGPADAVSDFGVASMTAPLRRVLVRRPATTGDWEAAGWRVPDPAGLERQHDAFCALLDSLGAEVEVAPALDGLVDAVYMH